MRLVIQDQETEQRPYWLDHGAPSDPVHPKNKTKTATSESYFNSVVYTSLHVKNNK